MTCAEMRSLLPLLSDPELLEPAEATAAEAHLALCPACRKAQAALAAAVVRAPGEAVAPPPAVWERIAAAVQQEVTATSEVAAGSWSSAGDALLFGKIALNQGLIGRPLLERALHYQRVQAPGQPLGEILVAKGVLTRAQVEQVLATQRRIEALREQARRGALPGRSAPSPLPGRRAPSPLPGRATPSPLPGGVAPSPTATASASASAAFRAPLEATAYHSGGAEEHDTWIGRTVGGCRMVACLARGGMGAIYRARHEGLQKDMVVKLLISEGPPSPRLQERFLREARTAARLDHPNVVRVVDVGQTDEGLCYIVMEYVDGEDLERRIESSGRCSPAEALAIVLGVARGLREAHAVGVIHRDVKASNILVPRAGGVKLTDFGLAKDLNTELKLTADGAMIGTPLYMAPEIGRAREIDGRVDIYSLGVTFYYLLTGVQPFHGFSALEILSAKAHERLAPPLGYAPDLPEAYVRVLAKMLATDRERRYASADELMADLEALERGQPVAADAAPPWPEPAVAGERRVAAAAAAVPGRACAAAQRPSVLLIAALGVGVVVVIALLVVLALILST